MEDFIKKYDIGYILQDHLQLILLKIRRGRWLNMTDKEHQNVSDLTGTVPVPDLMIVSLIAHFVSKEAWLKALSVT